MLRFAVYLLLAIVAGLGSMVWYGMQMMAQRDATIASMSTLVDRLKDEAAKPAQIAAADGAGDDASLLSAENARLAAEILTLREAVASNTAVPIDGLAGEDALPERLAALQAERDELAERATRAEGRIGILESELRSALAGLIDPSLVNTEMGDLQVEVTMLRHERDAARAQIDLLLEENTELRTQAPATPAEASEAADEFLTTIDALEQQVALLETDLADARGRTALLEDQLTQQDSTRSDTIDDFAQENDALSNALAAAETERAELAASNAALTEELDDARRELAAMTVATEASSDADTALAAQLATLTAQNQNLAKEMASLKADVETSQAELANATALTAAQLDELENKNRALSQADIQMQNLSQQVANLTAARDNAQTELAALRLAATELFTSDDVLTASSEAARAVEEQYRQELTLLTGRIAELETTALDLAAERTEAIGKISALEQQIARLQDERSTFLQASEDVLESVDEERVLLTEQFQDQLAELTRQRTELQAALEQQTGELNLARAEIARLQASQAEASEQDQLDNDLAGLKAELDGSDPPAELLDELAELKARNATLERILNEEAPPIPLFAPRE